MKKILVLGAGHSTPYLISYLLDEAAVLGWQVTVADKNLDMAKMRIGGYSQGKALSLDINDIAMRTQLIREADIVINFLPPNFQYVVALECIQSNTHMITASYQDERMPDLDKEARRKGLLILNEMGLDPGIDHMSAMALIEKIKQRGGTVLAFRSYGSGLPAPESAANPLRYYITWNPRNVIMAGETGAQYLYKNKIKILPFHEVFQRTWNVSLEGIGKLEAYPNRDSLKYQSLFGLDKVHTMIRGTLRYPGWSETWLQIVRLGLPNEILKISDIGSYSYRDLVEMFLPLYAPGANLEHETANFLNISPTGKIMDNLKWLGLFSEDKIQTQGDTAADVLIDLLRRKLALPSTARDVVAIYHELEVGYSNRRERVVSTFIEYGDIGGYTGMAKTVGLPAAIAAKLVLTGKFKESGCLIPTNSAVYGPVLQELRGMGYAFKERSEVIG
jgi:saccharopine dehydrogenase-like NADP-dependent oxidoreductase